MTLNYGTYLYVFLALVFVLALIAVIAVLARRFGLGFPGGPKFGRARRLSVIEVLSIGPKHRLVLVKRDDAEHLLLLGANTDTVVETDIGGKGSRSFSASLHESVRTETP